MRVKVRAVIWVADQLVVNKVIRRGATHVSLPGGRVNERESVTAALRREVREEIGIEIKVGELLLVAEVHSNARRQDLELIFEATCDGAVDTADFNLVDPRAPESPVLPPVLEQIVAIHDGSRVGQCWLGNLYDSQIRVD